MNLSIEERVARIEHALGISMPSNDANDLLTSPEGIREYKLAIKAFKVGNNQPLEEYTRKTGGRLPRSSN